MLVYIGHLPLYTICQKDKTYGETNRVDIILLRLLVGIKILEHNKLIELATVIKTYVQRIKIQLYSRRMILMIVQYWTMMVPDVAASITECPVCSA